jgi:hypothetical protein
VISQIPQIDKGQLARKWPTEFARIGVSKSILFRPTLSIERPNEPPLDGPIRNAVRNLIRMLDGPN